MSPDPAEIAITALGAQGDGIAQTPDGPRFVPFALPGERVRERAAGGLPELLSPPSPERRAPLCPHFGVCGGCVAQHMGDELYAGWKRAIVVEAFAQRGLTCEIEPLRRIAPGTRRRAVFAARREHGQITLGYHGRRSNEVFRLEACPVLEPAIVAQLPALHAIAGAFGASEQRLTVLATPVGLDVAVAIAGGGSRGMRVGADLARLASEHRIARIAVNGEVMIERAAPALSYAGVDVIAPPGAFVQAVPTAEALMAAHVLSAVGKAKRVADLFCGLGTFALPLARAARVLAIDSDEPLVAALAAGVRRAQGLKPIEARARDLFREPLSAKELEGFGAVVLDPPRAGAKSQAESLARSKVACVVYVSCNPGTLARDARILVDGGYRLDSVTPIDQFLFSAHVEAVAVFRR